MGPVDLLRSSEREVHRLKGFFDTLGRKPPMSPVPKPVRTMRLLR